MCVLVAAAAMLPVGSAHGQGSPCSSFAGRAVGGPARSVAWRAQIEARVAVYRRAAASGLRPSRWLSGTDAPWVMVLAPPRAADGRCWLHIRLPWRPNYASGWVDAGSVFIQPTEWRIDISLARRTLTLYRAGARERTIEAVVGKPSTPTPRGLFAVVWAIRWNPDAFLGSWVLELTAHSAALRRFDGGPGTVGIHGRGGSSLLDPLGSARSHGCVRLSNDAIDWLVRTIGARRLPGTPVRIS